MIDAVKNGAVDPDNGKFSPLLHKTFGEELAERAFQDSLNPQTHTVQAGDTLAELSERYYGDAYSFTGIAAANGISNSNYGLQVGQKLRIPGLGAVTDGYRSSLYQQGRSEIGRLGNEALASIRNFDYGSLYNADFSENLGAARELTNYHQRAALSADISYNSSSYADNGYWTDVHTASLNGTQVFSNVSRERMPQIRGGLGNGQPNYPMEQVFGDTGTLAGSLGTAASVLGLSSRAATTIDDIARGIGSLPTEIFSPAPMRPGPVSVPAGTSGVLSGIAKYAGYAGLVVTTIEGGYSMGNEWMQNGNVQTSTKAYYSTRFAIEGALLGAGALAVGTAALPLVIGAGAAYFVGSLVYGDEAKEWFKQFDN